MGKTKHLLLLAVIAMITMLVPQGAWAAGTKPSSGSGTSSSPYQIANEANLIWFRDAVNGTNTGTGTGVSICAKLTADITLTSAWTPIGNSSKIYTGTFDGQGHKISGMSMTYTTVNAGFFGYVKDATIKNFTLSGTMTSSTQITGGENDCSGAVVGRAGGSSTIQDIVSNVNITLTKAQKHLGGVVGAIEVSTIVKGCTYAGTLSAGPTTDCIGGIVGFAPASCSGSITNCFFNGTLSSSASGPTMGGILGYTNDESNNFGGVQNCYSCGTLSFGTSDYKYVNAIVGRIRARATTTINNTYLSGIATRACNTDGPSIPASNKAITISVTAGTGGKVNQTYVNPTSTTATQLKLEAAATTTGYYFTKWGDNVTDLTRTEALTGNITLTANFDNHYTLTVTANNANFGTVSGSGSYAYGDKATITATPKSGYYFVKWSDDNTNASRTVTVNKDQTLTAIFGEPKAVLSGNTLTFYCDADTHVGTTYKVTGSPGWAGGEALTTVVFDASFAAVRPATCYDWFSNCTSLSNITGLQYLNTSKVTDMRYMFNGCSKLTSLNLSSFNTANVTDMSSMFRGCAGLTSLDLSSFNTAKVTDMYLMFYDCAGLTSLTVNNFDMQNVTDKSDMFLGCTKLTTLNLKSLPYLADRTFNTKFSGTGKNVNLTLSASSVIYKGTNYLPTITSCNHYNQTTPVHVAATCTEGGYDAKVCSYCNSHFNKTGTIPALGHDFTSQTATNTYLKSAATCTEDAVYFYKCSRCAEKAETFWSETGTMLGGHILNDQSQCTRSGCNHQAKAVYNNGTLTFYFDDKSHTGTTYSLNTREVDPDWKSKIASITTVVFDQSFSAARPTSCHSWFSGGKNLTSIFGLEYLNTEEVTSMYYMFSYCNKLTSLDLSGFNTSKVKNMNSMFEHCDRLTSLDLSSFNTKSAMDMRYIFLSCEKLKKLTIGNFDMQSVNTIAATFSNCNALDTLTMKSLPYLAKGTFDTQFSGDGKVVNLILDENSIIYEGDDNHLPAITNCNHYNPTIVHVDATCTKESYDGYICSYCNSLFDKTNIVSALGHHLDANGICSVCYHGMVGETIPCTATNVSNGFTNETYDKAFDGKTSTKWCHNTTNPWVEFQTAWSVIVTGYKLSTANDTESDPSRNPKNWVLKGWSEEKQAWSVLDTKSNDNTLQAMNETEYSFELAEPGKVTYQRFRMEFTHSGLMQLSEISITGVDPSTWCEHEMTHHPAVAETCTTDGNKEYWTCSKPCCADKYFKDEDGTEKWASYPTIAACHDFTQEKAENEFLCSAATCTQQARYYFSCSRCDENEHDDNHTFAYGELAEHQLDEDGACTVCEFGRLIAKAVLADNTLTFYFDKLEHDGETYSLNTGYNAPDWYWNADLESITSVVFDASFAAARPTSCCYWFEGFRNLTSISGLEYLNTEEVTNMNSMFELCDRLTSLDLSSFNTKSVTDMYWMFYSCEKLKKLTIGNFDMQSVKNIRWMFDNCDALDTLTMKSLPYLAEGSFDTQFSGDGKVVNLFLDDNSAIYIGEDNNLPRASSVNYKRELAANKTVTFMLPFDVPVENINGKVYELSGFDGQTLSFTAVEGTALANTPYLLTNTKEGNLLKEAISSYSNFYEFEPITDSIYTSEAGKASMVGTYTKQTLFSDADRSIYGYSNGQFVRQKSQDEGATKGATINPFRAWIEVTGDALASAARLTLSFDEETTGVISLSDPELNERPVNVYSLDGKLIRSQVDPTTCLKGLPKGTYIIDGQRVQF